MDEKTTTPRKMTPRQRLFVAEYNKSRNATAAAIAAGYSKHTAGSQGHRLLKKAEVQQAINKKIEKIEQQADISAVYILNSLKEVTERCMQRVPVMVRQGREMVQKTDPETGEGIWEFDSSGANRALELLGKHQKLFTDKVEVTEKIIVVADPYAQKPKGSK